jgi:hypothetical protein
VSQWWVMWSSNAVVILASPKTPTPHFGGMHHHCSPFACSNEYSPVDGDQHSLLDRVS